MHFKKMTKVFLSAILTASLLMGIAPVMPVTDTTSVEAAEMSDAMKTCYDALTLSQAEHNQQNTKDFTLPSEVGDATVKWSASEGQTYITIDGTTAKVTRPYAGEGNKTVQLTATLSLDGETAEKAFNIIVREGLNDDSLAGYAYVCFADLYPVDGNNRGETDVQQLHFFLSEDGMNWTALNGCNAAFLAGSDFSVGDDNNSDIIIASKTSSTDPDYQPRSIDYTLNEDLDLETTVTGDASVLFPFEGTDNGVRDPYIIRGARNEDKDKIWILATDLNTHQYKYNGNLATATCGDWGTRMCTYSSNHIFVWETDDNMQTWTRRWVDLGSAEKLAETGYSKTLADGTEDRLRMIWAPEAIYNPEKDNYLVYWSSSLMSESERENVDREIYCCETEDFVNFGPVHLYTDENSDSVATRGVTWKASLDASQLRVDKVEGVYEEGSSIFYRLIKNESQLLCYLESSTSLLDPDVDFDSAELKEPVGNHYKDVPQKGLRNHTNCEEGPTMFKFYDRDEWCVMIDYYANMSIRYYPTLTYDLSKKDSISMADKDTYSRSPYEDTGVQDIGCHGGMIPITVEEYNTMLDVYNSDDSVPNYHEIDYIKVDTRAAQDVVDKANAKLALNETYGAGDVNAVKAAITKTESLIASGTSYKKVMAAATEIETTLSTLKTVQELASEQAAKDQAAKEEAAKIEAAKVVTAKATLQATISSANTKLKAATYSAGVTEVQTAINNANTLLTKATVTSAELTAADAAIKNALTKLVVKKATVTKKSSVKITGKSSVKRRKSITLKAKTVNLKGKKIKWRINNTKLAKLNKKTGSQVKLTAKKKKGTVKVIVTCGSKKATKKIKIK